MVNSLKEYLPNTFTPADVAAVEAADTDIPLAYVRGAGVVMAR